MIALPARPRILVVALRRLGDVLLTTPLIRSLKRAWPDATIDVLVFGGTEGILAGNPDIATVITMPERASARDSLALLRKLWRRYDLAISTQSGDRPTLFAWAAGRRCVGFVEARARWRASSGWRSASRSRSRRTASRARRAAARRGDRRRAARRSRRAARRAAAGVAPDRPYAVIHAAPMFRYKRWTDEGWRVLAAGLDARGLAVVATGGPDERRDLDAVWAGSRRSADRCALSWPELAALIAGARVYVGPDTSVTHLAAATGAPTVALYGPTDPRLWGPWPVGGLDPPWDAAGTIQQRGNVWLVQNPAALPALPAGRLPAADRQPQPMPRRTVGAAGLSAVDAALAGGRRRTPAPVAPRAKRRY